MENYLKILILACTLLTGCGDLERSSLAFGPTGVIFWSNGKIPYVFDKTLESDQRDELEQGMREWESHANIHFIPRKDEFNYVLMKNEKDAGCSAHVGVTGGQQELNITENCPYYAVLHELGHSLGLIHEHQRADRDEHVKIIWEEIEAIQTHNFFKANSYPVMGRYDMESIMHYDSFNFTKSLKPNMVDLEGKTIREPTEISPLDIKKVEKIYGVKK